VVGLSLGGSLTVELLARYPDLLHSAIISAPAFGPFPIHLQLLTRVRATLTSKDFFIRQNAKIMQIPPEDYAEFRQSQKQLTGPVIMEIMRAINGYRLNPALRSVEVPTLTVVGEKEMNANIHAARLVAATMPNAEHRIAPRCHHAWNGERPDLFNAMIRAWVSGAALPEALMGDGKAEAQIDVRVSQ
jgi:3-oxoadipate enol-lactonase